MKTVLRTLSDLAVLTGEKDSKSFSDEPSNTADFVAGYFESDPTPEAVDEPEPADRIEVTDEELEQLGIDLVKLYDENGRHVDESELLERVHEEVEEVLAVSESTTDDSNDADFDTIVKIMLEDDGDEDLSLPVEMPIESILASADTTIHETLEPPHTEPDEVTERAELVAQLRELFRVISMPFTEPLWQMLPLPKLRDLLQLTLAENGGSISVASIIQESKKDFDEVLKSEEMNKRLRLLEQKGADYAKLLASFSRMVGNDFTIKNARTTEYHAMLKNSTIFIESLSSVIMKMAKKMNMTIPHSEFLPSKDHIPIVEGMPHDPRILIYVLNTFYMMIDRVYAQSMYAKEELEKALANIDGLKERERRLTEELAIASRAEQEIRSDYENRIRNSSYYIIKDDHGRIVRKIDEEKPLETVRDLDLRGTIDTALFMTSKSSAQELADRMMISRRFNGRNLSVKTVSIV